MVRRPGLIALLALLGCGGAAGGTGAPLGPEQAPAGPATGLGTPRPLSRGVMGYHAAYLPDGRLVTVELGLSFELVIREPGGAEVLRRTLGPADHDINALAVDGDGLWVASADGTVRGSGLDGTPRHTWRLPAAATAVALSGDGRFVATGSADGVLCLRRRGDGALLQCVVAHSGRISALDLEAGKLASASWDGGVAVWSVPALAELTRLEPAASANDVALGPDGAVAVARSSRPPVRTPERERRERAGGPVADDPAAAVEVVRSGSPGTRCAAGSAPVNAVAWTADGRLIYGGWDRRLRLCDAGSGEVLATTGSFGHLVHDVALSPDRRAVAVAAWIGALDQPGLALLSLLYPAR
jgi:WD40 repeat protein